jgi:hypothetical protein
MEPTDEELIAQIMTEGTRTVLECEVLSEDRARVTKMKYTHTLGEVEKTIEYVNKKEHSSKYAQKKNQKVLTKAVKK